MPNTLAEFLPVLPANLHRGFLAFVAVEKGLMGYTQGIHNDGDRVIDPVLQIILVKLTFFLFRKRHCSGAGQYLIIYDAVVLLFPLA